MATDHDAPNLELDGPVDEDLIDYDSEPDEEAVASLPQTSKHNTPSGNTPASNQVAKDFEQPQILTVDPDSIDFGFEPETVNVVDEPEIGNNTTLPEGDGNAHDSTLEDEGLPEKIAESFEENEISWEDGDDEDGNEESKHSEYQGEDVDALASADIGANEALIDEITYEFEEIAESAETEDDIDEGDHRTDDFAPRSDPEQTVSVGVDGLIPLDIRSPAGESFLPNQDQHDNSEAPQVGHDPTGNDPDRAAEFIDYETYPEDGDGDNGESPNGRHDGEGNVSQPIATDYDIGETNYVDGQTFDEVIVDANDASDNASEDVDDEDANPHTESSTSSPQVSTEVATEAPAITVLYKNVEYPLFYNSPGSDGKECFFDDLGLLDCKTEELLANFRRELSHELSPFDELVFQVDELGLEFAESTHLGLLSEITLKGVVELYDQLLKNQDPDGTKPLYAYLVTRPNCKKRWEFLIDEAYTGKGIDEVGYYFQSPGRNDNIDEVLDEIANSHHDAEDSASQDESEIPMGDDYGDSANEPEYHIGDEEMTEEDEENVEYGHDLEADVHAIDSALMGMNASAEDVENTITSLDEPADLAIPETDLTDATHGYFGEQETNPPIDYNAPEHDGTSNPLLQWEGDEVDQFGDEQIEIIDDTELPAADQNTTGADDKAASKVTPNTSATSTMNGDDEITYGNDLDMNIDNIQNGIENPETAAPENGLDEIDWRDFPGEGDDDAPKLSPSTTGKRPRTDEDDLLDTTDEKDVKRRRS